MIPATLIPLLVLSIRCRFWGVVLYVIGTNLIDVAFYSFSDGFVALDSFRLPHYVVNSFIIRMIVMVSLGHLLVYFTNLALRNKETLMEQNRRIVALNAQLEARVVERTQAMESVTCIPENLYLGPQGRSQDELLWHKIHIARHK